MLGGNEHRRGRGVTHSEASRGMKCREEKRESSYVLVVVIRPQQGPQLLPSAVFRGT